jgi:hypothetical protein
MIKSKKADISQTFVYLSTALVIVIVLGFGFKWLMALFTNVSEVECIQFRKNMELKVRNNIEFGKIDLRPIKVDCDFRQVCFVSDPLMDGDVATPYLDSFNPATKNIIQHGIQGKVKQNVFFINNIPESFFYLEKLSVPNGIQCFNITSLGLNMKLEGKGNKVLLSKNVD